MLKIDKFSKKKPTDYRDIRSSLQNGDILLCSGNGIFSTMIQQATQSVWSHVAFILRLDAIDRIMLLESVEPIGVRTVRLSKYLEDYTNDGQPYPGGMIVIRHKQFAKLVNKDSLVALTQYAINFFGYPYDNDEIAKIAARILSSKIPFTPKQLKRIEADREFICSEYVAQCYEKVGLTIKWNQLGFIAPSDFAADANFELVTVLKQI
ncbi:hypothetical protein MCL36_01480 [Acinetobacter pittii]|uniref:hypothetical protein n=1 Tax=Acinetobacter pittii TaxID=48296 RepID=UPI0013D29535|nr:hypothetical protein [Acinetobacter pittii]MCG9491214.1 hypothetical protein [Acinetobacter pittii]